jgi:glycine dehydrogenase subunit 2
LQGRPTVGAAVTLTGAGNDFRDIAAWITKSVLIFQIGSADVTGVDLPVVDLKQDRLGGLARHEPIGLCGLSEPEVVRHYVRLSQRNASIDASFYPLGSCTMKHNPR